MKVEYLVVTQQDGCFCNNETAFNNLLQADTQIIINQNKLNFTQNSKSLEVEYSLETAEIKDKKQRYFHIRLVAQDDSKIDLFTNLIRIIRKIVERLNSNISINTLWDDISRHYIINAYPLINEVENLMRKLILKFMLVNVGMNWIDETMPGDLKKKISEKAQLNKAKNILEDTLHNADFIQLSGFLFDKKRNKELSQLDNLLLKKDASEKVAFGDLSKDFLPISNWDRHFSKVINYPGDKLEEKWKSLYDLRNKIAHNKNFSKTELESVRKISHELSETLSKTIEELDKVELNMEDKEKIVTSYKPSNNELFSREQLRYIILNWLENNFYNFKTGRYSMGDLALDWNDGTHTQVPILSVHDEESLKVLPLTIGARFSQMSVMGGTDGTGRPLTEPAFIFVAASRELAERIIVGNLSNPLNMVQPPVATYIIGFITGSDDFTPLLMSDGRFQENKR